MEYLIPAAFAEEGDKTAPPTFTQADGSVSYADGFGADYEADLDTSPDAKAIPRDTFNFLLWALTAGLREFQTQGVPDWITPSLNGGVAYPYDKAALVRYDSGNGYAVYRSLISNNTTLPTDAASWEALGSLTYATQAQAEAGTDASAIMSALRVAQAISYQTPFVGAVVAGLAISAPTGYLLADGSAVSRTTYARLFSVVGTTYGAGNGSTTFNLPDLRGCALVGLDGGRGLDAGRALGSFQAAQVGLHGHPWIGADSHGSESSSWREGGIPASAIRSFIDLFDNPAYTGTPTPDVGRQIGGGGSGKNRIDNLAVNWFIKF